MPETRRMFILITGPPLSGKTTLKNDLEKNYNVPGIALGDLARSEAETLGITAQEFGEKVRSSLGRDYLVKKAVAAACLKWAGPVVIEGIRDRAEIEYVKSLNAPVFVIACISPRETRLERNIMRGRDDAAEFDGRMAQESRWGLLEAILEADEILHTTIPVEMTRGRVEDIVQRAKMRLMNHYERY